MNATVYLVVGAFIGLLAILPLRLKHPLDILLNIILGIVGAFLAGWIFTPLFGIRTLEPSYFGVLALLVSAMGSVILLVVFNFLRWGIGQRTSGQSKSRPA